MVEPESINFFCVFVSELLSSIDNFSICKVKRPWPCKILVKDSVGSAQTFDNLILFTYLTNIPIQLRFLWDFVLQLKICSPVHHENLDSKIDKVVFKFYFLSYKVQFLYVYVTSKTVLNTK